ncbi:hypothetical protein B296_00025365 [Ensete ventricosum]|uniref:Uncharacterized protein n=1 Tax=Ensete ventricosum TaxID=4639 RepID=A0A427AGN0_ENSVE|nr:hypothetical protein B296_00025365 [Ensete ventricosum]
MSTLAYFISSQPWERPGSGHRRVNQRNAVTWSGLFEQNKRTPESPAQTYTNLRDPRGTAPAPRTRLTQTPNSLFDDV